MSRDGSAAFCRGHIACQHAHGGGFTRAVWPQKAENFAFLGLETDFGYGGKCAVAFGELIDLNHYSTAPVPRPAPKSALARLCGQSDFQYSAKARPVPFRHSL